ncbi:MAG: DUF2851 family protein [Chitinophagaceae bacterium]
MTEKLLHFIWQFQYLNRTELCTKEGEPVEIGFQGHYNSNQGPDFSDAKIRIGKTTWAGTVELHIKTSDWAKHHHQEDKNYRNVILHVVWEDDGWQNDIPVLELQGRVSGILLQRYEELMYAGSFIPCEKTVQLVPELTWKSWKDRLLIERLLRKARLAENYLQENNHHWEETFWWLLARNFGMRINADAFEAIARSLPLGILGKHKSHIHQLEALLMGQAGLLEREFKEAYPQRLQEEYKFYKNKYSLQPGSNPVFFLRMRPGNFPTIRLAQLAVFLQHSDHLFMKIKETDSLKNVKTWLDITASDYWHYHYCFDEETAFKEKKLGESMITNIIINTLAPLLFTYGRYHNENHYKEKAVDWLEGTAAESNSITNRFQQLGIINKTAVDSQALIELKNEYCNKKRCLECGIGNSILKVVPQP